MAFGIFNTGSSIGALMAPPLMALIVSGLGCRWVFFITGSIGFVWAIIWLKLYRTPEKEPASAAAESHLAAASPPPEARPSISWFRLFTYHEVQGLMLAKFLTDSAWYFFIFWLPKYLGDVRNLNIKEIGYFAWMPYACAGLGSLSGGWLSSYLIRRNLSLNLARKIALGISASLMPFALFIAASPLSLAIVFFSLAMFAHQFWSANVQTLPADLFPARNVGSVEGFLGSAGSFGGMLFGFLVGWMIDRHGYGPAFLIAGVLHPLAFMVILGTVRHIRPVNDHAAGGASL